MNWRVKYVSKRKYVTGAATCVAAYHRLSGVAGSGIALSAIAARCIFSAKTC